MFRSKSDIKKLFSEIAVGYSLNAIMSSYPQSGSTWLRYCIEYLSKRPTFSVPTSNAKTWVREMNAPLGFLVDIGVDVYANPIINKSHYISNIGQCKNKVKPKLLLLVRDYKDVIIRHSCYKNYLQDEYCSLKNKPLRKGWMKRFKKDIGGYIDNSHGHDYIYPLLQFSQYDGCKKIIYYEDIVCDLPSVLYELSSYLGFDLCYLSEFMCNIDMHKNNAIKIYNTYNRSFLKVNDKKIGYHKDKIPEDKLTELDDIVYNKYPDIFDKYLLRYKEK